MMHVVIWQVLPVDRIAPALLDGLNAQGKPFAVIRKGPTREAVWSFHDSRKLAEAAMRRWRSREIPTP